jgi:adenosylmethionine-8-amino-7-oxononanoate aminotransferase
MSLLYPFTDPVAAIGKAPKAIVEGKGCYVTDTEGNTYPDAVAGLWCAALGFDNERLIAAANEQMKRLPYYHSFMGRTCAVTQELGAKLVEKLPKGIDHVFFGCSGSDAVDTAAKLVHFYQNARKKPEKKKKVLAFWGMALPMAGIRWGLRWHWKPSRSMRRCHCPSTVRSFRPTSPPNWRGSRP